MEKEYFKVYIKNISGIETDDIKDGMEVNAYLDSEGKLKELYTDTTIYRGESVDDEAFLMGDFSLFTESNREARKITEGEATKELKFYPNVVMSEKVPTIVKLIELTLLKKNEELGKVGNLNGKKL